jgi:hypothetical protein
MVVDAADAPEKRKALTWLEPRVAVELQYNESHGWAAAGAGAEGNSDEACGVPRCPNSAYPQSHPVSLRLARCQEPRGLSPDHRSPNRCSYRSMSLPLRWA